MKKVCHLISSCITHHGPNNVLIPIVAHSDRNRYHFSVFSLYPPPADRDPGKYFDTIGVDFHAFRMRSFVDIRVLIPLVQKLRLLRPDILHCHLVRANIYGRIAAKLAGIPVVISTHHGIEDYMISDSLRDRAVRHVEHITDGFVTCHVGVSEVMRLAAIKYLGLSSNKIVTIPNGVDLQLYSSDPTECDTIRRELGLDPDAIVVGSVGILNYTKNFKLLLLVAKSVIELYPSVQFIVFGDGDQRRELEEMVVDLGLCKSIFFHGFSADIPHVLMALDIFALTSRSEGFGLAVAEAMASGLPCVTFDVGALSELIVDGQSGFLVPANDPDAFGNALSRLISFPDLRSKMGHAAQQRAKELFSAKLMVRRYGDLYDRLILG